MHLFLISLLQVALANDADIISDSNLNKQYVSNIFEGFGYSPECIADSLATCERSSKPNCLIKCESTLLLQVDKTKKSKKKLQPNCVLDDLQRKVHDIELSTQETNNRTFTIFNHVEEVKSLLQDLKSEKVEPRVYDLSDCIVNLTNYQTENQSLKKTKNCSSISNIEVPKNCAEIFSNGDVVSGTRIIYPSGDSKEPLMVFCDQSTDGGGWTVFQNRDSQAGRIRFQRTWNEYAKGFGDLNGEFWMGLDSLHALVQPTPMEMRVDLEDFDGIKSYAKYGVFFVGNSTSKYELNIAQYSGNAGNSMFYINSNPKRMFLTEDQDKAYGNFPCARRYRGAWWFNYRDCGDSNLNGYQHVGISGLYDGIIWHTFRGNWYSLKKTSMKVRPKSI